jgi:hypothetical protein
MREVAMAAGTSYRPPGPLPLSDTGTFGERA